MERYCWYTSNMALALTIKKGKNMTLIEEKAQVYCNKTGTHTIIKSPYNPQMVSAIKAIPGAKWYSDKKFWAAPADQLEVAKQAVRPYFQLEGEESQVEWKTVKMRVIFEQNKRHAYRKAVIVGATDLLNVDHGNTYKYSTDFDILEEEGGFVEGDEHAYYWKVEYILTVKMRKNAVIEAVRGTYEVID
jgi:hypothetical protein